MNLFGDLRVAVGEVALLQCLAWTGLHNKVPRS